MLTVFDWYSRFKYINNGTLGGLYPIMFVLCVICLRQSLYLFTTGMVASTTSSSGLLGKTAIAASAVSAKRENMMCVSHFNIFSFRIFFHNYFSIKYVLKLFINYFQCRLRNDIKDENIS